jgi:hypothetical protein
MNEVSKTSAQMTCADSSKCTCSQESDVGRTHCDKLVGLMIDPDASGLFPAPANLSPRLAKELGLLTSGTYGLRRSTSSRSANLNSCLVNRLKLRLSTGGSTLYKLIWKEVVTPFQRSVSLLRASVPRTSGNAFTGWVTPTTRDWKDTPGMSTTSGSRVRLDQLPRQAAQWVAFGQMRNGSSSKKESDVLFNPALARWLIGLPVTWDDAVPTETQLSRLSQPSSLSASWSADHD